MHVSMRLSLLTVILFALLAGSASAYPSPLQWFLRQLQGRNFINHLTVRLWAQRQVQFGLHDRPGCVEWLIQIHHK